MPTKQKKKYADRQVKHRSLVTLIFTVGCFLMLINIYYSGWPLIAAIPLAIIVLIITGFIVSNANSLPGYYGLYLYGTTNGINIIEWFSKRNIKFWKAMAEWGLVMGFGIIAYFVFKKQISKKMLLFGIITNAILVILIVPYSIYAFKFINIPLLSSELNVPVTFQTVQIYNLTSLLSGLAVTIGGLSLLLIGELVIFAVQTLHIFATYFIGVVNSNPNPSVLTGAVPGVAPLIPGVTLPLIAGILSLAIVIVVHEFSHGVLARILKIKVKKVGLALFGIIPIGAFVEPDEKALKKLPAGDQNAIFIAGISSNLITSVIFFIPMILMLIYIMPSQTITGVVIASTAPGTAAYNVIAPGTFVYQWNGYLMNNDQNLTLARAADTPNKVVAIVTNKGTYNLMTNSTGKIGVTLYGFSTTPKNTITAILANFFYSVFALVFLLSFLVGALNVLPVPSFDGWRIYQTTLKNEKLIKAIVIGLIICIAIGALPLLRLA